MIEFSDPRVVSGKRDGHPLGEDLLKAEGEVTESGLGVLPLHHDVQGGLPLDQGVVFELDLIVNLVVDGEGVLHGTLLQVLEFVLRGILKQLHSIYFLLVTWLDLEHTQSLKKLKFQKY